MKRQTLAAGMKRSLRRGLTSALVLGSLAACSEPVKHEPHTDVGAPVSLPTQAAPAAHTFANVTLPTVANEPTWIRSHGVRVGFRWLDAAPVAATSRDGATHFEDAYRGGDALLFRRYDGVEDWVVVADGHEVRYALSLSGVSKVHVEQGGIAGDRGDVVHFEDTRGRTRVRAYGAKVFDRLGKSRSAHFSVDACTRSSCMLTVSWSPDGLAYPVALDPTWSTAIVMAQSHARHTLTAMSNGEAVIMSDNGTEVFRPGSASFTNLGAGAGFARADHTATATTDGVAPAILFAGGRSGDASTTCVALEADLTAGVTTCVATDSMGEPRTGHAAGVDANGEVILIGGTQSPGTIDKYVPGSGITQGGAESGDRVGQTAVLLSDGRLLFAGGTDSGGCNPAPVSFYANGALTNGPTLPGGVVLPQLTQRGGTALFAGGANETLVCASGSPPVPQDEVYELDLQNDTWVALPSLNVPRERHALVTTLDGSAMVLGGQTVNAQELGGTEIFASNSWHSSAQIPSGLLDARAVRLPSGDILIAGGHECLGCPATNKAFLLRLDDTGEACSLAADCASGFCVDGVCCDTACDQACTACSAAAKGSGTDGACEIVTAGLFDPRALCGDEGVVTCGLDGRCDAAGACSSYPPGAVCRSPLCTEGTLRTGACDGAGVCVEPEMSCDLYACTDDATACHATCTMDAHCAADAFCDDTGACVRKDAMGARCSEDRTCATGFCADGVCCDGPCSGQCERCNDEGQCVPQLGEPHGDRPACDAGEDGDICQTRACDGQNRAACSGFVGAETVCAPAFCSDGEETFARSCTGDGHCAAATSEPCDKFRCGDDACHTSCDDDSACANNATCDGDVCVGASRCLLDDQFAIDPAGETTDCFPFRCSGGACLTQCNTTAQCVDPFVCGSDGTCVPAPDDSVRVQGCGCEVAGKPVPTGWLATLMAGLAAVFAARRRRGEL